MPSTQLVDTTSRVDNRRNSTVSGDNSGGDHNGKVLPSDNLRATPEYEIAFNIEAWKRKEQSTFRAKLADTQKAAIKQLEAQFNSRENERISELEQVRKDLETMASRVQRAGKQADERTAALNDRERRLEEERIKMSSEFERTLGKEQHNFRVQGDGLLLELEGARSQLRERDVHIRTLEERLQSVQNDHDKLQRLLTTVHDHEGTQSVLVRELKGQIDEMAAHMRKLEQIAGERGYEAAKCRKEKEEAEAAASYYIAQLREASKRCELLEESAQRVESERIQQEAAALKQLKRATEFDRLRGGGGGGVSGDVRPSVLLAERALHHHNLNKTQIQTLQGSSSPLTTSNTGQIALQSEIGEMRDFLTRLSENVHQREKNARKEQRRQTKRWQYQIENNVKDATPLVYASTHPHPPLPEEVYQRYDGYGDDEDADQPSRFHEHQSDLDASTTLGIRASSAGGGSGSDGAHTPQEQLEAHSYYGRQASSGSRYPHDHHQWEVSVSTMSSNGASRIASAINTPERHHDHRFRALSPQRRAPQRNNPARHISSSSRSRRSGDAAARRPMRSPSNDARSSNPNGSAVESATAAHHVSSFAHGQPWRPKHTPPSPRRGAQKDEYSPNLSLEGHSIDLGLKAGDDEAPTANHHHAHEHHHHEHQAAASNSAAIASRYFDTPSSQRSGAGSVLAKVSPLSSWSQEEGADRAAAATVSSVGDVEPGMESEVGVFVKSLKQSRANILATGAYTENDELVRQMDERIARYSSFLRENRF